jgi:nucleotide-binding universal stress UspA family protein
MFDRILVAVDGSSCSDVAVRAAAELAVAHKSTLAACHVFHIPEQYRDDLVGPLRDVIREDGEKILDHAVRLAGTLGAEAVPRLVTGKHPAAAILSLAAELRSELIVLGARGKSTDGSREIGSVGSAVVSGAKSSVLIVRKEAD